MRLSGKVTVLIRSHPANMQSTIFAVNHGISQATQIAVTHQFTLTHLTLSPTLRSLTLFHQPHPPMHYSSISQSSTHPTTTPTLSLTTHSTTPPHPHLHPPSHSRPQPNTPLHSPRNAPSPMLVRPTEVIPVQPAKVSSQVFIRQVIIAVYGHSRLCLSLSR